MGTEKGLRLKGYELDEERTEHAAPTEVWVNKKVGLGIRLEWFGLRR